MNSKNTPPAERPLTHEEIKALFASHGQEKCAAAFTQITGQSQGKVSGLSPADQQRWRLLLEPELPLSAPPELSALHRAARAYAAKGRKIFPITPDSKKPLTGSHGFKDASNDLAQIDAWWTENPDYNIGFEPDSAGLAVIEADTYKPTFDAAALAALNLPETYEVESPRGGVHHYFVGSVPPKASALAPAVDCRGRGSYVLLPPSVVEGKPYTVRANRQFAVLPTDIEARLAPRSEAVGSDLNELDLPGNVTTATARLRDLAKQGRVSVSGHGGNNTAYQVAAELARDLGLSQGKTFELMREIWNPACQPPWSDDELATIVTNASSYGQNAAGAYASKPASETFKDYDHQAHQRKHEPEEISLVPFSQIKEERITWLVQDRIPIGKLTLIAGTPGDGKTNIAVDITARQSKGEAFPFNGGQIERSAAVWLSAEDDPADTLKPRLRAAGADMSMIYNMDSEVRRKVEDTVVLGSFNLEDDMRRVEARIVRLRAKGISVKSLILDPISAYMGGSKKGDMWKNPDTRHILKFLTDFAARQKVAVIGITHLNKSADTRALYRVVDSIGMTATARMVWITAKETDDDGKPTGRSLFANGKVNIAKDAGTLAFRIEGVFLPAEDGGPAINVSRIKWEGCVATTADQALAGAGKGNSEGSKLDKAVAFLEQALADGPLEQQEVHRRARKQKQAWRTIERAKHELGINVSREGFGRNGRSIWNLPDIGEPSGSYGDNDVTADDPDAALLYQPAAH